MAFGKIDLADQRLPLLRKDRRHIIKSIAFVLGFLGVGVKCRNPALRPPCALLPFAAFCRDRREPPIAHLGFACQRLGFAANLGEQGAFGRNLGTGVSERGFQTSTLGQGA
jgi:hypothetical protein